jgi:hemolysin III
VAHRACHQPDVRQNATEGLLLLLAGGLSYTAGVVFFMLDSRWRYGHFVWHLFVVAGTVFHYFAVMWCAA